jgi:hypothetical protein
MCFFNSFNSFFLKQVLPKVGTESEVNILRRVKRTHGFPAIDGIKSIDNTQKTDNLQSTAITKN